MISVLLTVTLTILLSPLAAQEEERPDALRLYNNGQYERAVEVCKAELEETPRNMDSYAVLCWSLVRLGRYEEARGYAEAGLNISRQDLSLIHI